MKIFTCNFFILLASLLNFQLVRGQGIANGVPYQTIVRNSSGAPLINQAVSIKLGIYKSSATGVLQWEETFTKLTDQYGLVKLIIGSGLTSGNGSSASFSAINWAANTYYFKMAIDITGGTSYVDVGSAQLLSVPYVFYSLNTDALTDHYLDKLVDVNVPSPLTGKLLKWNGALWIAANDNDSDTVLFAYNTFHSIHSDTSFYSYSSTLPASILFAYDSDTSQFTNSSLNSLNSINAVHSDTAMYALSSGTIAWKTDGNTIASALNYLGTTDTQDLVFKTNNTETIRLNSIGNVLLTGASTTASFSLNGNDGVLSIGAFASGSISTSGFGTKLLWYPNKASFRVGEITSTQWDDANIGNYSFAAGYNCIAGNNAFASGNACIANGDYAIALGRKAQATAVGVYPGGVSVALGDSSIASMPRSLVMGKGNVASTSNATYAIGYYNLSSGAVATSFGTHSIASGSYSFVLGYYGSSNLKTGSFVYADASSSAITNSTANNQFLVRASGGIIFYTDSLNTMGVMLPAGGGSWASVSDKNKKENFITVNADEILNNIEKLEIKSWNYKSQSSCIKHIGPMAQDFYKVFKIGDNNKTIAVIDMDGVTLSGIKTLYQRIKSVSSLTRVDELKARLNALDDFTELNSRLDVIESKLSKK